MFNPERTAIRRNKPSAPIQKLWNDYLITGTVLDFGAGKGDDANFLLPRANVIAWDPNFIYKASPTGLIAEPGKTSLPDHKFDTVLCTYVLNVLTFQERRAVVDSIKKHLKGKAYISVRGPKDRISGQPHEDGIVTSRRTFQRLYTIDQLLEEIPGSVPVYNQPGFVTVSIG